MVVMGGEGGKGVLEGGHGLVIHLFIALISIVRSLVRFICTSAQFSFITKKKQNQNHPRFPPPFPPSPSL